MAHVHSAQRFLDFISRLSDNAFKSYDFQQAQEITDKQLLVFLKRLKSVVLEARKQPRNVSMP